jgi:hypothetical protein
LRPEISFICVDLTGNEEILTKSWKLQANLELARYVGRRSHRRSIASITKGDVAALAHSSLERPQITGWAKRH